MPWCPTCKNEYREGITVCPDCNAELLAELPTEINYVPLFQTDNEVLKDKVISYFEHCGIAVRSEIAEEVLEAESEENEASETTEESTEPTTLYNILVDASRSKEASKELMAILSVEASAQEGEDDLAQRRKKSAPAPSTVYVNAKDRYSEYRSSGMMFIGFGALLLLFSVFNIVGVLSVMSGVLSLVLIFILAIAFVLIGISSLRKSKTLVSEAEKEENKTEQITEYLKTNFTKEVLFSMEEEDLTPELLFLKQLDVMKEQTLTVFPDTEETFLDTLLEDYLNTME